MEVGGEKNTAGAASLSRKKKQHYPWLSATSIMSSSNEGDGPPVKKMALIHQSHSTANKQKVPLRVGSDLLAESFYSLPRWDMDGLPLVSRRFRAIILKGERTYVQRRVVEKFHSDILETPVLDARWYVLTIKKPYTKGANPKLVPQRALAHYNLATEQCMATKKWEIRLSTIQLLDFLHQEPNFRARTSSLKLRDWKSAECFARLWDGGTLELCYDSPYSIQASGIPSAELFGRCASLLLGGGYFSYNSIHSNNPRMMLGSVAQSRMLQCQCVEVVTSIWNVTLEDIVDHLFFHHHHTTSPQPSTTMELDEKTAMGNDTDGGLPKRRELKIKEVMVPLGGRMFDYTPKRLEQLIRERLRSTAPRDIPNFSLELGLRVEGGPIYETELPLPTSAPPLSNPPPSSTKASKYTAGVGSNDDSIESIKMSNGREFPPPSPPTLRRRCMFRVTRAGRVTPPPGYSSKWHYKCRVRVDCE